MQIDYNPLNELRICEFIMKVIREEGKKKGGRKSKKKGKIFLTVECQLTNEEMMDSKVSMMIKLVSESLIRNKIFT